MNIVTRRNLKNSIITISMVCATVAVLVPLGLIFFHIMKMGASSINLDFFIHIPKPTGETGGGMANGMVGSALLIALASTIGIPVGVFGALYLVEFGGSRISNTVRFAADVLSGVPSIITGMVAYTLLVVPMKGFSALAGAVALSLIMVPIVLRTTEEQLKMVPGSLREASLALGVPLWRTSLKVTLRSATKGVMTGILLAIARIAGETAPLLFTALGNQFWSKKLTEPIAAMPLQIFNFAIAPYEDWHKLAWAGALVLVTIMFGLSLTARYLGRSRQQS
ncbi:phosphate ABC transporter, inner membrane subunit PstA [Geobacter metallireducens RCH3]|uniref:Phosphate transport system permease protein PstA n=1 Tax=Geobacter metallireducens (strain ATCC 53774 / DSM 7210 / GS-15) TaxID=269799 RepID=Q39S53_GEOMG|nr:phosphate ABC transporter permease PstA [Geobacter metallireducens]ABB32921.1 phosphate ABC transporter, membrane protein PstA [Geobacter metallireducens GS-15]EHP88945.1 phosphate ABC transporter, inner membrane subunit PstA [Geobacter metallireducens RCH3]